LTLDQTYSRRFFSGQQGGSKQSARTIVRLLMDLVQPSSVIDVGCGVGAWLAEFGRAGVEDALGVDGPYVPRDMLQIPAEAFVEADLSEAIGIDRQFDLAISLEVGEHLPPVRSEGFVSDLTSVAPVVAFSAAIPLQGGRNHINERWQGEWAEMFAAHDFVPVDAIRPQVWEDESVAGWYRQNLLLYVRRDRLDDYPPLAAAADRTNQEMLSLVHPYLLDLRNRRPIGPILPIIGYGMRLSLSRCRQAAGRMIRGHD